MNTTLSTFLKIGITALAIGFLLFGTAYSMTKSEADSYEGTTTSVKDDLPTN